MIGRIKNIHLRRICIVAAFLPIMAFGLVWYALCGAAVFAMGLSESAVRVWSRDHI